jgi:spermidine/putrescine transport system ATP-binding protein
MNNRSDKNLQLENISKRYGTVCAVNTVSLTVPTGSFFTLLGPSGCGKTTLLRIIAGLELQDSGRVILGGQDISGLPATKRQVNTVFQSYALFPHLTIYENIAFGLRARKFPEAQITERVLPRLELLGLESMRDRMPHQLSGGQKQRVALARALVNEPDVLLLDEPMSALDAQLRSELQVELRKLQQKLGQTFILVTHDQDEALVVSDTIAVMRNGAVEQTGTPEEVYDRPKSKFVAEFLGAANLIEGDFEQGQFCSAIGKFQVTDTPRWRHGTVAVRPEWIRIHENNPGANSFQAKVKEVIYRGSDFDIWCEPGPIRVRSNTYKQFQAGDQIWLELAPTDLVVLDE